MIIFILQFDFQCLDIEEGVHITELVFGSGSWIDTLKITLSGKCIIIVGQLHAENKKGWIEYGWLPVLPRTELTIMIDSI